MKMTNMNIEQMWSLYRKFKQNPDGSVGFTDFMQRAEPGSDYIMIWWCGMWLGIELDGYCHS